MSESTAAAATSGAATIAVSVKQPPAALLARLSTKTAPKKPGAATAAASGSGAGYSNPQTKFVTGSDGVTALVASDGSAVAMTNAPQLSGTMAVAGTAVPTAAKRKIPKKPVATAADQKSSTAAAAVDSKSAASGSANAVAVAVPNSGGQHHFPAAMVGDNTFLKSVGEKLLLNQYWFSAETLAVMVAEATEFGTSIACLSTPSVYFSLPPAVRANARVFDIDTAFATDPGFVEWSFKAELSAIPARFAHSFDYVIIDPPFITEAVWMRYAATAKYLLKAGDDFDTVSDTTIDTRHPIRVQTPFGIGIVREPAQTHGSQRLQPNAGGFLVVELSWGATATLNADACTLAKPFRVSTPYGLAKVISPQQNTPNVLTGDSDGLLRVEFGWGATARINVDCARAVAPTPRGKVLLSTIPENDWVMRDLLGASQCRYRPCIPTLIYQYSFFCNYQSHRLEQFNPEIDPQ